MSIPSKFVRINENIKFTNSVSTNMSSGTLNLSTGLTTGTILATTSNATNVSATNIVGTIVNADTYTGGSMSLSGNLNLAGTLTTVNITSTNISETNVSAGTVTATNINVTTETIGTARITGSLLALGNSNTVGNVFTTGGNIGIGTTAPAYTLDVIGSFEVGTSSGSALITSRTSGNIEQHFELAGGTTGGLNTTRFYSRGLDKTFGLYNVENTRTQMRLVTSATVGNDRLCLLEGGGSVGIGTNSPGSTFDIKGSSTWGITRLAPSISGDESAIGFFALNDFTASSQATSGNWLLGTGIPAGGASNFNLFRNTTNILSVSTNGNVGIGTSSPSAKLTVAGITNLFGKLSVAGDADLFGTLRVGLTTGTFLIDLGAGGAGGYRSGYFYGDGTSYSLLNQANGSISFGTNNIEARMILNASGNVGIGTVPSVALHVKGNSNSTGQQLWLQNYNATSGNYWKLGPDGGNNNMTVYNQNNIGVWMSNDGTSWNASSDIRIKKDVEALTSGLDLIEQLRPVKYRYNKDDAEKPLRIGFIAQEVRDVIPEVVSSNPTEDFQDGLLGLSLELFVPYLVNAIKNLSTELQQTKSDLQKTKSDFQQTVNNLLQRIDILENSGA